MKAKLLLVSLLSLVVMLFGCDNSVDELTDQAETNQIGAKAYLPSNTPGVGYEAYDEPNGSAHHYYYNGAWAGDYSNNNGLIKMEVHLDSAFNCQIELGVKFAGKGWITKKNNEEAYWNGKEIKKFYIKLIGAPEGSKIYYQARGVNNRVSDVESNGGIAEIGGLFGTHIKQIRIWVDMNYVRFIVSPVNYSLGYYDFQEFLMKANSNQDKYFLAVQKSNANWERIDRANELELWLSNSEKEALKAGTFNLTEFCNSHNFDLERGCYYRIAVATGPEWTAVTKLIQIKTPAVPALLSNNYSGYKVSASSTHSVSYAPWKAFDSKDGTANWTLWISSASQDISATSPAWIELEFPNEVYLRYYRIIPQYSSSLQDRTPRTFTFDAYMDGKWVTISSRSNISNAYWTGSWGKTYQAFYYPSGATKYKRIRLNVTETNGSPVVSLRQIVFYN